MAAPQRPILPQPTIVKGGKAWSDIWNGFAQNTGYLRSLVRYLQQYLGLLASDLSAPSWAVTVPGSNSPYAVASTDVVILATGGSAGFTVQLPPAIGKGRLLMAFKIDAGAGAVTVAADGTDSINGNSSIGLTSQYALARLIDAARGQWLLF
jgi:hypothetical protein